MKPKRYDELSFSDDFMFCKVLQNNEDLCAELLELILDRKVGQILRLDRQQAIEITADGKGVRFDVSLEDDLDAIYSIEMQNSRDIALPKRSRYYQAMVDLDCMERGMGYNELKKSFIIFICNFDPFGGGLSKYTVRNRIEEGCGIFDDETRKIFLNTRGSGEGISPELKGFLAYVAGQPAELPLTKALEKQVERVRGQQEWRREYMTLYEINEQIRKEALAEGREEGLAEGREEGLVEGRREVARALKEDGASLDMIVRVTGLTEEEVLAL